MAGDLDRLALCAGDEPPRLVENVVRRKQPLRGEGGDASTRQNGGRVPQTRMAGRGRSRGSDHPQDDGRTACQLARDLLRGLDRLFHEGGVQEQVARRISRHHHLGQDDQILPS